MGKVKKAECQCTLLTHFNIQTASSCLLEKMQKKCERWLGNGPLKDNFGHFAQKCPA